jgi:SAM-dependent methyltransferase
MPTPKIHAENPRLPTSNALSGIARFMPEEAYTGTDVLENLAGIDNYNDSLAAIVSSNVAPGAELVDFGAGIGTFAKRFAESGHRVTCIEPDERMLARLRAEGFTAEPSLASAPDGSLEAVYSFNVLEHIEDDVASIREIHRKLRPGGLFVVYVPANRLLWTAMDDKVKHFRRYGRHELRTKLLDAGFRIRSLHHADVLGMPAALAYRLIGPKDGTIPAAKARFYDRWIFPASRALDLVFRHLCGKNLAAVAEK